MKEIEAGPTGKSVPESGEKKSKEQRLDRRPGALKGKIWIGPDFEDPLPEEILAAFRGEGRDKF
jgi:hypothetical protein